MTQAVLFDEEPRLAIDGRSCRRVRESIALDEETAVKRIQAALRRSVPKAEVTVAALRDWEAGATSRSMPEIEAWAEALLLPFGAMADPASWARPQTDFRTGEGAASYSTHRKLRTFDAFCELAKEISLAEGSAEDVSLPVGDLTELLDARGTPDDVAIERFAMAIRGTIGLTRARQDQWADDEVALADAATAVEGVGVFVFTLSLDTAELRGASRWDVGMPPAVLLSSGDGAAPRLFTLAHELTHLCLRQGRREIALCTPFASRKTTNREELVANRVAGALLVPSADLEPLLADVPFAADYRSLPWSVRQGLRERFNVSNSVLGVRLAQMGFVGDPSLPKPSKRGGGGKGSLSLPVRYRRYLGPRALTGARAAVANGSLGVERIARLLDMRTDQVAATLET